MRTSGSKSKSLILGAGGIAASASIAAIWSAPLAGLLAGLAGAFCAVVALKILPRYRDERIQTSEDQLWEARGAFKQVVDNLPVGLFMFQGGRFTFTNWAWDEQMMRLPGQTPDAAFKKALQADQESTAVRDLAAYEKREEPFSMGFLVQTDFGDRRHIESQGVPVYGANGEFQHLLGFNIDVTSATESASALDNKNKALERAFIDLEDNLEAMIASLVKAIEAKDQYTAGHSERVMEYSVRIGQRLGLSKQDMKVLKMGTLIHDIGKIGVPDHILTKPDKLTDEEFEIIKRHPAIGFEMIRDIPFFRECAPIVRWHHERLNGTGYPDGLKGEEISLLVQISTIADMFDAMTSNRAYRRSLGVEVAVAELRKDAARGVVNSELVEVWAAVLVEDGLLSEESSIQRAA